MLPAAADEDAFVAAWAARADQDGLLDVVEAAVQARRLRLAARLVGLLEPGTGDDRAAVERARGAARLVLVDGLRAEDVSWSELEDALRALHRDRVERAKQRQRLRAAGREERVGRLDGSRRRR